MPDLVASMLTVVLLCCAMVTRPTRARCPAGYDLRTGVRPSGEFRCWPHPVGDPEWDGTWMRPDRARQPDGAFGARVYCTGGATPRQDGTSVWCQR